MKNLRIAAIALIVGLGFTACESKTTETEKETVVVEKEVEATPEVKKEEDGVKFGIERDKDGKVGVEVEGKVD